MSICPGYLCLSKVHFSLAFYRENFAFSWKLYRWIQFMWRETDNELVLSVFPHQLMWLMVKRLVSGPYINHPLNPRVKLGQNNAQWLWNKWINLSSSNASLNFWWKQLHQYSPSNVVYDRQTWYKVNNAEWHVAQ